MPMLRRTPNRMSSAWSRQYDELFSQLAALPGVEHVAGIMGLPTGNYGSNGYYNVSGGHAPGSGALGLFHRRQPRLFSNHGHPPEARARLHFG